MATYERSALSILRMKNEASSNIKWNDIHQKLLLNSSIAWSPIVLNAHSRLWYQQFSKVARNIYHVSAISNLVFNQKTFPKELLIDAASIMILVGTVTANNTEGSKSLLGLSQTVNIDVVHDPVNQILSLEHAVILNINKVENVNQILQLIQGTSQYSNNTHI